VPRRAEFAAEAPRLWLPKIVILDQIDIRYRFRLVGRAIVAISGRDATGRYLDETVSPIFCWSVIAPYGRAANLARPIEDDPSRDPTFAETKFCGTFETPHPSMFAVRRTD
jgi:hypothetical protein